MFDTNYTTPEGFTLPKPLHMPEARTFAEVLDYLGEWDHKTMTHYAGELPEGHRRPEPRYIPEVSPQATAWERRAWRHDGRNEIGPYCSVDLSQLDGPRHRGIAVRATDATIAALTPAIVTPDDHISFEVIGHKGTGRALVTAQHGYIIGSIWLAYIDPASVPAAVEAAR